MKHRAEESAAVSAKEEACLLCQPHRSACLCASCPGATEQIRSPGALWFKKVRLRQPNSAPGPLLAFPTAPYHRATEKQPDRESHGDLNPQPTTGPGRHEQTREHSSAPLRG
ncbi:hypothetical protein WMY93_004184 [Mugilogobius chulae]|uniref:Uncharacterized protein n=1 Tax=Mugilogobius chulae TaxID=88201 RepID=A0AAW0PRM0_9GOBI